MEFDLQRMAQAGDLAFAVVANDFHRPLVDGKANRDMIEDSITIGMMAGALGPLDQKTVDMAIQLVNDLLSKSKDHKL